MSRKLLILLFLTSFVGLAFRGVGLHQVKVVFDGDTIQLQSGERVRYFGIDTPELGDVPQFMAVEARQRNLELVAGKRVRLEADETLKDRHGRRLAYVFLENGDMVNALLVREGLAHVLVSGPQARHFSALLENQRSAMKEGVGIWSREGSGAGGAYMGNTRSYVFHRPDCVRAGEISRHNRRPFHTRRSAFWEGFHPCTICRP